MKPTKEQILDCINQLKSRWQDRWGLIHTVPVGEDKSPSTLNGVLYTGIIFAMIDRAAHEAGCEYDEEIVDFLTSLISAVWACLEPKYPLVSRTPTNQDQEGPDDYKGLTAMLARIPFSEDLANEILVYGENKDSGSVKLRWWLPRLYRWLNNSGTPDRIFDRLENGVSFWKKLTWSLVAPWGYRAWLQPWMGRFPAITFSLEANAGKKPRLVPVLFAAGSLMIQALFGNNKKPDSWYMDWTIIVCNENAKFPSKIVTWCAKKWYRRLFAVYPRGMRDVWKQYCGPYGEEFPLSRFFLE
jgi:hypothetical protein